MLESKLQKIFLVLIVFFKINLCIYTGEENGSPLQYSCLENPVDGGA